MSKASVSGEVLGKCSRKVPRGLRGRHVAKDHQRKLRTSGGSPRHRGTCTAKASRINRSAAKSRCAYNWGGWGRLSVEGPGQNNPDRSEDPWGRAAAAARAEVHKRTTFPDTVRGFNVISDGHEGRWQTGRGEDLRAGKAAPEIPALKPYWGKPTVRVQRC